MVFLHERQHLLPSRTFQICSEKLTQNHAELLHPSESLPIIYFTIPIMALMLINSDVDMFWAVMLRYPTMARTPFLSV